MANPLIQIDDKLREMTREELAEHQIVIAEMLASPLNKTDETPSPD